MTLAINGGDPVRHKFLSFSEPDVQEEDIEAAVRTIRTGWLSTGKEATKFEEAFAKYKGGNIQCVALSSCTAALHLALLSLDLTPDDEVLVPDMTFSATAAAVVHAGGKPIFVDVDRQTQNIDITDLKNKVTNRTVAVVLVHFAGSPCRMELIEEYCNHRDIMIIEDCAHAIETVNAGVPSGTKNYAGCFSFYGTKNITTTIGEGGMLISKHPRVIEFARKMSLHGMTKNAAARYGNAGFKHYDILAPGYKYNMPDVSAAFARSQLERITYNLEIRKSIWTRYIEAFEDLPIHTPRISSPLNTDALHLFTIQLAGFRPNRDWVLEALTKEGIGVGVHYMPLHTMSYWREAYNLHKEDFPNAEWLGQRTLSLPLTAALSQHDVDDVITAVKKVLG